MAPHREQPQEADNAVESALEKGLAGLQQAASQLGANAIAVLVAEAFSLEIIYPQAREISCSPEVRQALNGLPGPVPAGAALAGFLRAAVAS